MGERAMRRTTRDQGFPNPAGTDGAPYWRDRDVLRWAARQGPPLSARVPLRLWPDAVEPAEFLGAVQVPQRFCRDDVVLRWSVAPGTVAVIWRCDDPIMLSLTEALGTVDADVLVTVDPDFGIHGPGVRSRNRAAHTTRSNSRRDDDALSWTDLARVLGRPMPYWPLALRDPELIATWYTVVAPAQPNLDSAPLLRMAAMFDPDHATHRTLINLVRVDQDRATRFTVHDLEMTAEAIQRSDTPTEEVLAYAATPMVVGPADADDSEVDELTRRIGWLELLDREDVLSKACIGQAMAWDGGEHFPFSSTIEIDPGSAHGREWIARLRPTPARTAQFVRLDLRDDDEALVDPLTDAPVVRQSGGRVRTVSPLRLPSTSRFAEVVLAHPVWVRTADGALYPAPTHRGDELDWRRHGHGPRVLAVLLDRLLTDITTEPADTSIGAAPGLCELAELPWPPGTVLDRDIIEAARDGRPLIADPDRMQAIGRAALEVLLAEPGADPDRLAAVGLGTGGSIALELARAGVAFRALAAVHPGVPANAQPPEWTSVTGTVLLATGSEDPLCTPTQPLSFSHVLQEAQLDWRVNIYGGARHAFWHPPVQRDGALADAGHHEHEGLDHAGHHPQHAPRLWNDVIALLAERLLDQ